MLYWFCSKNLQEPIFCSRSAFQKVQEQEKALEKASSKSISDTNKFAAEMYVKNIYENVCEKYTAFTNSLITVKVYVHLYCKQLSW